MKLGPRIAELRAKKGVSLQEVADAIGMSKAHVRDLEVGDSDNPSVKTVKRLANYFDVPILQLIEGNTETSEDEVQLQRLRKKAEKLTRGEREVVMDLMASLLKWRQQMQSIVETEPPSETHRRGTAQIRTKPFPEGPARYPVKK